MPDFTYDPIKYNPGSDGNTALTGSVPGPYGDPRATDENAGDHSGKVLAGGPLGMVHYQTVAEVQTAAGDRSAAPSPLNHVTAEARFTDADGAGAYILGHGTKTISGANAGVPMQVFPAAASYLAAFPNQKWVLGAIFAVNGTAIPNTLHINVGFYRVTVGGGSDALAYTLSGTGKIVESYTAGFAANSLSGVPNGDRRSDFAAAGDQNYALGVELSAGIPTDCVLDLSMALQLTPY